MTVTHDTFLAATPDERTQLVESLISETLKTLRPADAPAFDGSTHLADLAIDSIQLVEMKFALDQLAGADLDVAVFIANPTVHELAMSVAASAPVAPTAA